MLPEFLSSCHLLNLPEQEVGGDNLYAPVGDIWPYPGQPFTDKEADPYVRVKDDLNKVCFS